MLGNIAKFVVKYYFFCYQQFFIFFIFHTQHNIISKIKQNKTTDTYSTSQGPIKREGEREGQQAHKSYSFIQSRMSNKKHCQASMVEGLAPPTRAVVHSHDTICRRLRIQYVFLHMCGVNQFWIIVFFTAVKPANNILFCIELIQRPESSLGRHKLGLTDQSIRSNDDKTRFTCVHKLMTTGHSQNICRKVPDDVVLHIWQFKFDCSFILNLLLGVMVKYYWCSQKKKKKTLQLLCNHKL